MDVLRSAIVYSLVTRECSQGLKDVRVTGVSDDDGGHGEELSNSGSELNVVSVEVVNVSLGKHGVVLKLSSSDGGAVLGDDHELGLALSEGPDGVLVSNLEFSRLDNEVQLAVEVLLELLLGHQIVPIGK